MVASYVELKCQVDFSIKTHSKHGVYLKAPNLTNKAFSNQWAFRDNSVPVIQDYVELARAITGDW